MNVKRAITRTIGIAVLGLVASTGAFAQGVQVLVVGHGTGNVLVYDSSLNLTGTVTLPTPASPIGIAINPAGTLAAVTNFNNFRVDFLDLTVSPPVVSGSSVSTISDSNFLFPEDVVFSSDGACLAISDGAGGVLGSVDVTNRTLVSLLTSIESEAVEFVPNNSNNLVLTADFNHNEVHVLTLGSDCSLTETSGSPLAMPSGAHPRNIAAFPNGQRALVANGDGTVSVLSVSGTTVSSVTTISLPDATPGTTPSAGSVQSILIHPKGSRAYAYQSRRGNIELLNIDSSGNVTDSGSGIAVSPGTGYLVDLLGTDGAQLFLSTSSVNAPTGAVSEITAINLLNNTVTGSVSATDPAGMAVQGTLPPPSLSGINLKGANLAGAELSGANLKGANLNGANLTSADLAGANLQGANLKGADLQGGELAGAYLQGANLLGVNLTNSDLAGANLQGANLKGANLAGADLSDADLQGANLLGANLTDSDLAGANLQGANVKGVTWANTVCPDGTNSNADGQTCQGHF